MRIYMDHSNDFWPRGWMVYACVLLGTFDLSLIAFLIRSIIVRH